MKHLYLAALLLWSAINAMAGVELTAPTPQQYAEYGYGVSANGKTLAVINTGPTGVVYVYQPTPKWNTPALVAELTASDGTQFTSVAVYGNVILAGATGENQSQGLVYGFIQPQGGWQNATQSFVLSASDGAAHDNFGYSFAFSNKTIVVGATGHGLIGQTRIGAAYVFTEPVGGWTSSTQTAELTPSDESPDFGQSVAVNGPVVVVGTPGLNDGALYVYQENVGGWQNSTETAQLTDPGPPYCRQLGQSVTIVGTTVVGGFSSGCSSGQERVVMYNRPGNAWTSMSTPTADLMAQQNTKASSRFGWSLALTNKFLAVGDPLLGSFSNRHGAVFVYAAPQGGWQDVVSTTEAEEINSGTHDSQFGNSVSAFSTGTIFVGAPESVVDGVQGAGAVFIKSY
jgi:hypothetical protein